ncbi:MAG: hypothetical protein ACRC9N_12255 [Aeromonas sp.]
MQKNTKRSALGLTVLVSDGIDIAGINRDEGLGKMPRKVGLDQPL